MAVAVRYEVGPDGDADAATSYCFPPEVQDRFARLQAKNNEGALSKAEADELRALVREFNARTRQKAEALLDLQRRGALAGIVER